MQYEVPPVCKHHLQKYCATRLHVQLAMSTPSMHCGYRYSEKTTTVQVRLDGKVITVEDHTDGTSYNPWLMTPADNQHTLDAPMHAKETCALWTSFIVFTVPIPAPNVSL